MLTALSRIEVIVDMLQQMLVVAVVIAATLYGLVLIDMASAHFDKRRAEKAHQSPATQ